MKLTSLCALGYFGSAYAQYVHTSTMSFFEISQENKVLFSRPSVRPSVCMYVRFVLLYGEFYETTDAKEDVCSY